MVSLRRIRNPPSEARTSEDAEEALPAPVERAAPGVAALLDGLTADGGLSVLDLGSASESSFRLYAQYARRIRFADIRCHSSSPRGLPGRLEALGPDSRGHFDLVLAWNVLDWLGKDDRSALVERLVQLTTPEAKLYVLVDASEAPTAYPLSFTLLERDRVLQQPVGPSKPTHPQLLPAEVERLLMPFRVSQGFWLRQGWREYVAVK